VPVLRLVLALSLLLSAPAATAAPELGATLPTRGVLAPGKSLGGIELGATRAQVRSRWGSRYTLCTVCTRTTWLYTYRGRSTAGAAVSFRDGRVAAVFTLGVPSGWHTSRGISLGDPADKVHTVYGVLPWSRCIGYGAVSIRRGGSVASIYTYGDSVYGFALTLPSEPVCQ
jgi:hypothetical protein